MRESGHTWNVFGKFVGCLVETLRGESGIRGVVAQLGAEAVRMVTVLYLHRRGLSTMNAAHSESLPQTLQLLILGITSIMRVSPSPTRRSSGRYEYSQRNRRDSPTLNGIQESYILQLAAVAAEHLAANAAVVSSSNHCKPLLAAVARKAHFIRHPQVGTELCLCMKRIAHERRSHLAYSLCYLRLNELILSYSVCLCPQRQPNPLVPPSHWVQERRCNPL